MAASFHIGILPNRPLADFVDWVARAETLGFGGVWVADSQSVFLSLIHISEPTRPY